MAKRQYILRLLMCLLLIFATGCRQTNPNKKVVCENDLYQILSDGERSYIRFHRKFHAHPDWFGSNICAKSIIKLRDKLVSGNLSDNELIFIGKCDQDEDGDYIVWNTEKLYTTSLPADCWLRSVDWDRNETLVYHCESPYTSLRFFRQSNSSYDTFFASYYTDWKNSPDITITSTRHLTDINGTEYGYTSSKNNTHGTVTFYTLQDEAKTLFVREEMHVSEGITYRETRVFVTHEDQRYFIIIRHHLFERLPEEWLMKLEMVPYKLP